MLLLIRKKINYNQLFFNIERGIVKKLLFVLLGMQTIHGAHMHHAAQTTLTSMALAVGEFTTAFRKVVGHRIPPCYREHLSDLVSCCSTRDNASQKHMPPILAVDDRRYLVPFVKVVDEHVDKVSDIGFVHVTRMCIPHTVRDAEDLLYDARMIRWVMNEQQAMSNGACASRVQLADLVREQEKIVAAFSKNYRRLGAHDVEAHLLVDSKTVRRCDLLVLCNRYLPVVEKNQDFIMMRHDSIQDDLNNLQITLGLCRCYRAIRALKEKAEGVENNSNLFMSTFYEED